MRSVLPGGSPMNMLRSIRSVTAGSASSRCSTCRTRPCRARRTACCAARSSARCRRRRSMTLSARCELAGFTSSSISMSSSLVRPITRSCSLDRQRVPRSPCRVRTSARARSSRPRSRGPRRRSGWRSTAIGPVRVLGAVDETHQVAVVEELEAVHLVDDRDRAGHRVEDACRPARSSTSIDSALMWNSRSPGVDGA